MVFGSRDSSIRAMKPCDRRLNSDSSLLALFRQCKNLDRVVGARNFYLEELLVERHVAFLCQRGDVLDSVDRISK